MGSAMALAKSTLAPRIYKTGPPNYYTQTSFSKRLDVVGNFIVDDTGLAASGAEKVPTSTGLVTWAPNRGAGSVYHWGIVPQGGQTTCGTYTANSNILTNTINGLSLINMVSGSSVITLTYASATAVPYNGQATADLLKVSPDLSQSFSQVRVYSGDLRVICDTVPIGNTALNGYFSAGSVSDSRDVSQVSEGSNPANCFDPSDLVQTSVTAKEGLKEVSVMKGIITLVGSDIQPFYSPPNTDETDTINAGWTTYNITNFNSNSYSTDSMTPSSTQGVSACVMGSFFSPWNVQLSQPAFTNFTNFNTGPINLNGVLDFQLVFGMSGFLPQGSAGNSNASFGYRVTFTHIFATCQSNVGINPYGCTYLCQQDVRKEEFGASEAFQLNTSNGIAVFQTVLSSNPRMFQTSLPQTGIYIGTQITASIENNSNQVPTQLSPVFKYFTVQVRARSLYNQGELGPMRIIRWDGMSNGQQIKVDGVINAQCIPEGNIAPFVQNSAMFSDTAHNLNTITFLAELYNGDSPVRRNWTLEEYIDYMKRQFPDLSVETLMAWNQPKLIGTAEAAGAFDSPVMGYNAGGSQYLTGMDPTNRQYSSAMSMSQAKGQFGSAGMFGAGDAMSMCGSEKRGRGMDGY